MSDETNRPQRLPNGNLLVQLPTETDGIVGEALVEIGPDHPAWAVWDEYLP